MSRLTDASRDASELQSVFTRLAQAIGNTDYAAESFNGKMKGFAKTMAVANKIGYATLPFYFRLKNRVETTLLALGKISKVMRGGTEDAGMLGKAFGSMSKQFGKAKNALSKTFTATGDASFASIMAGTSVVQESNLKKIGNFLSFGATGAIGKGAKGAMGGVGAILGGAKGGISKLIGFAKADDKRKRMRRGAYKALKKFYAGTDKIQGILTKVPLKKILINLGAFALLGVKMFIGLTLAIGVLLLFLKSEAFQNAFNAFMEVLRSLKEPLIAAFNLIKDGFMLIYNGLFGGGGFWSSLGMVLTGLGKILMGILKGLFTVAFGLLKAGLIAVGVAIKDAASFAVEAVIKYLTDKAQAVKDKVSAKKSRDKIKERFSGMSFGGVGMYARGGITGSGLSIVGERGPELVKLPMGSRVFSNDNSKKMISKGSVNNITVNVQGRIGASDTELRQIASKIGSMINKEVNRTTSSRGTIG